jgi:apolipoprotein N-acyltransferase
MFNLQLLALMKNLKTNYNCLFFLSSLFIVALGQNAWIGFLGYFAQSIGYLLFFISIKSIENLKKRFFLGFFWFFIISAFHLSWFASVEYQTFFILIVYVLLTAWVAVEFGLICLLVPRANKNLSFLRILTICSVWTLFEIARRYVLCGFTWSIIGLCLANNKYSITLSSIFGVYGLSFWVLLVNLLGYFAILSKKKKFLVNYVIFAIAPYVLGFILHAQYFDEIKNSEKLNVALIQTSILPKQRGSFFMVDDGNLQISPYAQWNGIFKILKPLKGKKLDYIVFPEVFIGFDARANIYFFDIIKNNMKIIFGEKIEKCFPKTLSKNSDYYINKKVSNLFILQTLCTFFNAQIVGGLEHIDANNKAYNSAFFISPNSNSIDVYNKQVLVPIGEYFPINSLKKIAKNFGIFDSYSRGDENKLFSKEKNPFAVSICYEETYGNIVRKSRRLGASFLINITNDAWFSNSKLPNQHYEHSKIRAAENGVSVIRACNTGVTAMINPFGEKISTFLENGKNIETKRGFLYGQIPTFSINTLFVFWGDNFIIFMSVFFISLSLIKKLLRF